MPGKSISHPTLNLLLLRSYYFLKVANATNKYEPKKIRAVISQAKRTRRQVCLFLFYQIIMSATGGSFRYNFLKGSLKYLPKQPVLVCFRRVFFIFGLERTKSKLI